MRLKHISVSLAAAAFLAAPFAISPAAAEGEMVLP